MDARILLQCYMSDDLSARWDELTKAAYTNHQPGHGVPEREPLLIERLRVAQTFELGDQRLEDSHANLLHYYYCDSGDRRKVEVVCRYWMALKDDRLTASSHDLFVLMELGAALSILGRDAECEPHYRRALQIAVAAHGVGHRETHGPMFQLAQYLYNAGKYGEAVQIGERLLAVPDQERKRYSTSYRPWFMRASYVKLGRLTEAETLLRQEMVEEDERRAASSKDDEPGGDIGPAMHLGQLADIMADQGHIDEAVALKRESVTRLSTAWDAVAVRHEKRRTEMEAQGHRTVVPMSSGPVPHARRGYAELLLRAGCLDEAEAEYRQLLVLQEADAQMERSWIPTDTGRGSRAIHAAQRACVGAERRHPILAGLAAVLRASGRDVEAEPLAAEATRLQAGADALRDRLWRIYERRVRLAQRRELISVKELQRLLATPLNGDA